MKKELGKAPLPINGWLILAAVSLLYILYASFEAFTQSIATIVQYASDFSQDNLVYNLPSAITQGVFGLACLPLAILSTLSFFQRRHIFVRLFVPLQILFVVYILLFYLVMNRLNYYQSDQFLGFTDNSISFSEWYKMITWTVLGVGLIVYLFRSQRVKQTFVFASKESLPKEETPPRQINGWLILVVFFASRWAAAAFFSLANALSFIGPNTGAAIILSILESVVRLALSVFLLVCIFRNKKAAKWLLLAFIVYKIVGLTFLNLSLIQQSGLNQVPWYAYLGTFISHGMFPDNLCYAALIVYLFASRRVRATFTKPLRVDFRRAVPAVKKSLQYGLPDETIFTDDLKERLDAAIASCKAQAVGGGYVDIVTAPEYILPLIDAMQSLNIRIRAVSWWRMDDGSKETTHEGLTKKSLFFPCSFSETLVTLKKFKKDESYNDVKQYIFEDFPKSREYLPCLVPGFWLDVPESF
jgi:hypothetical protein